MVPKKEIQVDSHSVETPTLPPHRSIARSWLINFAVLLGSVVFVFFVLEIALRIMPSSLSDQPIRNDRALFYYSPTSNNSLEDFHYPPQKAPGDYRIAVLGDSFTFPTFLQFDDAFPKRLERMLNLNSNHNSSSRAEVLNFGRMGASTEDELHMLPRALHYQPDMVILEITLNDPQRGSVREIMLKHPNQYSFGPLIVDQNHFPWLQHFRSLKLIANRLHNRSTHESLIQFHLDLFKKPKSWNRFARDIQKFNSLLAAQHIKFRAVIFPMFFSTIDNSYPFFSIHEKIHDLLDSQSIAYLDLLETYRDIPAERLQVLPGTDSHPNEIAHRLAAERIYLWLEERGDVPADFSISEKLSRRGTRPEAWKENKLRMEESGQENAQLQTRPDISLPH